MRAIHEKKYGSCRGSTRSFDAHRTVLPPPRLHRQPGRSQSGFRSSGRSRWQGLCRRRCRPATSTGPAIDHAIVRRRRRPRYHTTGLSDAMCGICGPTASGRTGFRRTFGYGAPTVGREPRRVPTSIVDGATGEVVLVLVALVALAALAAGGAQTFPKGGDAWWWRWRWCFVAKRGQLIGYTDESTESGRSSPGVDTLDETCASVCTREVRRGTRRRHKESNRACSRVTGLRRFARPRQHEEEEEEEEEKGSWTQGRCCSNPPPSYIIAAHPVPPALCAPPCRPTHTRRWKRSCTCWWGATPRSGPCFSPRGRVHGSIEAPPSWFASSTEQSDTGDAKSYERARGCAVVVVADGAVVVVAATVVVVVALHVIPVAGRRARGGCQWRGQRRACSAAACGTFGTFGTAPGRPHRDGAATTFPSNGRGLLLFFLRLLLLFFVGTKRPNDDGFPVGVRAGHTRIVAVRTPLTTQRHVRVPRAEPHATHTHGTHGQQPKPKRKNPYHLARGHAVQRGQHRPRRSIGLTLPQGRRRGVGGRGSRRSIRRGSWTMEQGCVRRVRQRRWVFVQVRRSIVNRRRRQQGRTS